MGTPNSLRLAIALHMTYGGSLKAIEQQILDGVTEFLRNKFQVALFEATIGREQPQMAEAALEKLLAEILKEV